MKLILSAPNKERVYFVGSASGYHGRLGKIRIRTRFEKHFLALINSEILRDTHLQVRRQENEYQIDLPMSKATVLNIDGTPHALKKLE